MPSTTNQPPKLSFWIILLLCIMWLPKWFLLTRRAARANRRADTWIAKACQERGVRELNTLDFPPSTPEPPERALKSEVEKLLDKHVPRYFDHVTVRQLWHRRFTNVLWHHPKDQIYTTCLRPRHNPPQTPFEVAHGGGRFVFRTSGLDHFLTYLLDPSLELSTEELSRCFSYGYTSLWILEHGRTFFRHEMPNPPSHPVKPTTARSVMASGRFCQTPSCRPPAASTRSLSCWVAAPAKPPHQPRLKSSFTRTVLRRASRESLKIGSGTDPR